MKPYTPSTRMGMLRAVTDEEVISDSEKEDEESGHDSDETIDSSTSTVYVPTSIVDKSTSKAKSVVSSI